MKKKRFYSFMLSLYTFKMALCNTVYIDDSSNQLLLLIKYVNYSSTLPRRRDDNNYNQTTNYFSLTLPYSHLTLSPTLSMIQPKPFLRKGHQDRLLHMLLIKRCKSDLLTTLYMRKLGIAWYYLYRCDLLEMYWN